MSETYRIPLEHVSGEYAVNALDKRTGRIHNIDLPLLQLLHHLAGHAVRSNDHGLSNLRLLRVFDHRNTHILKMLYSMPVMDDRAKGYDIAVCYRSLLHQFHCPIHTKAEAGTFRDLYTHKEIFSPTILRIAATTPSISSAEVSTLIESRAIFSGAMARWVS